MILFINTILLLTSVESIQAQTATDSLYQVIAKQRGQAKIESLLKLSAVLAQSDKAESRQLADEALKAAQKIGNKTLEIQAFLGMSKILQKQDDKVSSQAFLDSALFSSIEISDTWYRTEILLRIGINQQNSGNELEALKSFNESIRFGRISGNYRLVGSCYSMMGNIYRLNGLYDRAIEYIIKSKLNYEKSGFAEGKAWTSFLLGRIYADLEMAQKATDYFHEALAIYKKTAEADGNTEGVASCYEQLAEVHIEMNDTAKASEYAKQVFDIHSQRHSTYGLSNAYKLLGRIELMKNNYLQANQLLANALDLKKQCADILGQATVYEYLAMCYLAQGNPDKALNDLNVAEKMALDNNQRRVLLEVYANQTAAYLKLGRLNNAVDYQNKRIAVQDELLTGSANTKFEQLQSIYEIDEKNSQISELEKQNEINNLKIKQHQTSRIILISGIILVLCISLLIYFLYNKIRIKNKKLNEAIAAKDKLFSIVSHDLKGPIGSTLALSEFLFEEIEQENLSTIKQYAVAFNSSLKETFNLLTNLLDWSRSQLNRISFSPVKLKLLEVVDEITDLVGSSALQKSISIKTEIAEELELTADKDMLKTILRNLVSNALKFTRPGGTITVSAVKNEKQLVLTVADTGIGIPPEMMPKLFAPNSNYGHTGTMGEKGTGLGLILVKEFVARHGGEIHVESTPGQGTSFRISLPLR